MANIHTDTAPPSLTNAPKSGSLNSSLAALSTAAQEGSMRAFFSGRLALLVSVLCLNTALAVMAGCDNGTSTGDSGVSAADAGGKDGSGGVLDGSAVKPDSTTQGETGGKDSAVIIDTENVITCQSPNKFLVLDDGVKECVAELELLWIERLKGKDFVNVDDACQPVFCNMLLDNVYSSSYIPPAGWEAVMKDGVKDVKYQGKLVWSWMKKNEAVTKTVTTEKLELWSPPELYPNKNFGRYQITAEIIPNGTIVVAVTLWNCDSDGATTTAAAPLQKYQVIK
jgi:hypothetical protein